MAIFSFIRRLMLVLSGPANDLVFLSYSNGDTGTNFSDHLNSALTRAGLRTFRNADDTRRGENTESETRKAIQESKISVIVFSKDYAFSTRCLDNLVMIMDAREATGHIVLPIFYHLDPSEVRNQEGRYFEAFSAHEEGFQGEVGRVKEWRAALREAADVAGMVLQDRYEAEFIESIVKAIADKLNLSRSSGFTTLQPNNLLKWIDGFLSRISNLNCLVVEDPFPTEAQPYLHCRRTVLKL